MREVSTRDVTMTTNNEAAAMRSNARVNRAPHSVQSIPSAPRLAPSAAPGSTGREEKPARVVASSSLRQTRAAVLGCVIGISSTLATPAIASRPSVHVLENYNDFHAGDFDGTSLNPAGEVVLGPAVDVWTSDVTGPVLALVEGGDGAIYVGTAAPARVYRVTNDGPPELVVKLEKPIITALLAVGKDTLVALSAPDGGAHIITIGKGKAATETRYVEASGVKTLYAGVVDGDTLYVVGGGEEGALLSLALKATAFTTLATVKEKSLRSVTRAPFAGRQGLVIGGGDDGIVYLFDGKRMRALVDAVPTEVTSVVVDKKGRVFAALVDAQGKLTDGATGRDTGGDDKSETAKPTKSKEKKPRKVKSSEVLRIDPDGSTHVLWQSKKHGAYALLLDRRGLLVGTGAQGQLLVVDPDDRVPTAMLARAPGFDELVALIPGKSGTVLIGTAHGGGVLSIDALPQKAGSYTTGVLDAGAVARYGHLSWVTTGAGRVSVAVRTGGTDEPDDTWSEFSPPLLAPGVPIMAAARHAQVRVTFEGGAVDEPRLQFVRFAHLPVNRPPAITEIEVVAPGFKVRQNDRDPPDSRSVSFGKQAFKKTPDSRGGTAPLMGDRPSGKQISEPGYRTVYAYVEDPDGDALRYRFTLLAIGNGAPVVVKDWTEEPFLSLDMSRFADGAYRVVVDVDDALTNGAARTLADQQTSAVFHVAHRRPDFLNAKARAQKTGARVSFDVDASVPLSYVACSVGGSEWLPVDPTDGILDTPRERFDAAVAGTLTLNAVSCVAVDEAGNTSRSDIPLGR